MNLLRFRRRQDPFLAAPTMQRESAPPSSVAPLFTSASGHKIYPGDVCAACLERACLACSGFIVFREPCLCPHPGAARASRFFDDPHGIATDETVERIVAEAEHLAAEAAATAGTSTEPWDKPADLMPDHRDAWSAMPRMYVPHRSPDVLADMGGCVIFRDAVRACFVRQERARGNRREGTWQEQYAGIYADRTRPAAPDYDFAGPLRKAHAETIAAVADGLRERMGAMGGRAA